MSGPRRDPPRRILGSRSRRPGWDPGGIGRPGFRVPGPGPAEGDAEADAAPSGSGQDGTAAGSSADRGAREPGGSRARAAEVRPVGPRVPRLGSGPLARLRLPSIRLPAIRLPRLRLPGRPGSDGGGITRPSWLTPRRPARLGVGRPGEPVRPGRAAEPSESGAGDSVGGESGREARRSPPPDLRRGRGERSAVGDLDREVRAAATTPGGTAATAEMVVLSIALVAVSRVAEGPALWACAVLTFAALVLAALEVLGTDAEAAGVAAADGVPVEALLTPGLASLAAIGALRLLPIGWLLLPGLAAAGLLVAAGLAIERRILLRPAGPTDADRLAMLSLLLLISFLGFAGIAAAIPGALAEPTTNRVAAPALPLMDLGLLATADGIMAGLAGYRLAALRAPRLAAAALTALTYAVVVAIAAAALRALAIPRLLGPALLALVIYLWSAYRGAPRTGRRDARWVWELILLTGLGALVVAWNLLAQA